MEEGHRYVLPDTLSDGRPYALGPGQIAYVTTGHGDDTLKPTGSAGDPDSQFHFEFFQNCDRFIWSSSGDAACLYDDEGRLIDSMRVP